MSLGERPFGSEKVGGERPFGGKLRVVGKRPLVQLDEYLDELNAYRDDVHLTAVSPHNLSGSTLEAFTFLWRGDADAGAVLQEKLPFRG